jgi:non-specific serine/threonine protein kinase
VTAQNTPGFGELLRRHRVAAGLTQETLAERAGLSVYGIQKLERGVTHAYRDTAERLVLALELALDEADRFRSAVEPVRRRGSPPRVDRPANPRGDNLPVALTSFVGRERELASIPPRLRTARLLTLSGSGGSGKTRLAVEMARCVAKDYRDGVRLVELAQVTDPGLVPHALAAAVGVQQAADRPLERALADALRDSETLLVLDNCEHLLDACASLIDLLLRECPSLNILATSREPIGMLGEVAWSVPVLPTPDTAMVSSVADIEGFPAVRLFVDRAVAVQPSFELNSENAGAVAQICRQLDGIPLALELAAARLGALTPGELADRLGERFALLTGGNRAALPRHQTLRGTIDWSYFLLSETQRRVFERLSVFANGWTLKAAETVCAGQGVPTENVLDSVLQLVQKLLIVKMDLPDGRGRYAMLETLRQYAWDKLLERDASEAGETRDRHAAYYSSLMQRVDPALSTTLLPFSGETLSPREFFQILDDAHQNVQLALKWWLDSRRAIEGLELIRALGPLWIWVGVPTDGLRWMEATLELADSVAVPPALRAQALMATGPIALLQGEHARHSAVLEASVALWRVLRDPAGLSQALTPLALGYAARQELDRAREALGESLELARSVGDGFLISGPLMFLGMIAYAEDDYQRASAYLREALDASRSVNRASYRAITTIRSLVLLGHAASKRGEREQAMSRFAEALVYMREIGLGGRMLGYCLDSIAAEFGRSGDIQRAAVLFGAADVHWRRMRAQRLPVAEPDHAEELHAVRVQLGEAAFLEAWRTGRSMDMPHVFDMAIDRTSPGSAASAVMAGPVLK